MADLKRQDGRLILEILRAIGARPSDAGFERISIEGYSADQASAAVSELHRGGYVVAAEVSGLGDNGPRWEPSVLTVSGRHLLEELEK